MFIGSRRRVLTRSLSNWCIYLAGLLQLTPYIVPFLPRWVPWWGSVALIALAPFARIIDYGNLHADK